MLPLPWNTVYQQAWLSFLTNLNTRYSTNPAFTAIAIAGPIGASTEIILPTTSNNSLQQPGVPADVAWATLIKRFFPNTNEYLETDKAFIEQWQQAIKDYESIFTGVTLFLSADAGNDLPEFTTNPNPPPNNTTPLFAADCATAIARYKNGASNDLRSCEAKAEILSYFVTAAGSNAKATQDGGMRAASPPPGDIGLAGVKYLTSPASPATPPFLGGAEFDHPVSGKNRQEEGCPTDQPGDPVKCKDLTPEAAGYNVLTNFFNGTPAARHYGGQIGTSPVQYLEVPYEDVAYAAANPCPPRLDTMLYKKSLQDLLNSASHDLFAMAGQQVVHQ